MGFSGHDVFRGPSMTAWRDVDWVMVQRWSELTGGEAAEIAGSVPHAVPAAPRTPPGNPQVLFGQVAVDTGLNAYYFEASEIASGLLRCAVNEPTYRLRVVLSGAHFYRMGGRTVAAPGPCAIVVRQPPSTDLDTVLLAPQHLQLLTLQASADALASLTATSDETLRRLVSSSDEDEGGIRMVALDSGTLRAAEDLLRYDSNYGARFRTAKTTEIALRILDQLHRPVTSRRRACVENMRAALDVDPGLDLDPARLTSETGMNRTSLRAWFKNELGRTMADYRADRRWTKALELLASTDLSVKQIAHQLGFKHAANFSTAFRKQFGMTPGAMRDEHRKTSHPARNKVLPAPTKPPDV